MNCREFWNTMPEPSVAHPHLAVCSDCAARMEQRRQLAGGLRALAEGMSGIGAPARVEARLLAAFRAHTNESAHTLPGRRRLIPAAAWAAALAAILLVGVLVVRDRRPAARTPEIAVAETTPAASDSISEEGFLPLPGAAELPPADDLDLVRVELPRSAMMQVGIAVSPDRAAERVRADVMVGADGMARAVRFFEATGSD
jgi:hypothetical protein